MISRGHTEQTYAASSYQPLWACLEGKARPYTSEQLHTAIRPGDPIVEGCDSYPVDAAKPEPWCLLTAGLRSNPL